METSFLENQIEKRRKSDDEMFQGAFSDLLSIVGINTPKAHHQARGAVAMILKYLGKDIPTIPDGVETLDAQLDYMLKPSDTMRRRVELHGEWWKDNTGCLLGSTIEGDVVAIFPRKWGGYEYISPEGERIKINSQTAKNLNVDAFCFYRAFPLKSLKIRDLLKFMVESLSFVDVVFILSSYLVAQLLGMAGPIIQKIIYKDIIPSGALALIWPLATFYVGKAVGKTLMSITSSIVSNRLGSRMTLSVNSAIMIRFFTLPTKFFKGYTAGELASRMGYIASLCQIIRQSFASTLSAVFSFAYFFQMYQYGPSLVLPGMIIVFVTVAYQIFITFYRQSIYNKKLEIDPKLQSWTYALFGGIQKIKVTGSEKRAFAKWAEIYSDVKKLDYSPPLLIKISGIISLIISTVGQMVLYYCTVTTGVSLDDYMGFNMAYGSVTAAIMSLSGIALQIANLQPILKMIKPVMEQKPESGSGRKIPTALSGNIEMNNISFKYDKDGPTILDNISLKVKKGEYIGIVGKTGCGKSTLMRILLGFEDPDAGAVYYDGHDLTSLDLRSVRQKIGVVMQNGSLFPSDIFSNIIITSPWKTMDDAWEAARMAGIEEDIKAMPMGMHTLISEGAGGLSGGQKQRLMIARAIINRPSILFLDEATSALDNITQNHVSNSIAKLNSTRVVIAHRLSTIKNCDRILVMDKGKIVEQGTYDELMDKKGEFYELAIRQVVK